MLYALRRFYPGVDMDSLLILLCVSDATMRKFMVDLDTPPEVMHAAEPPDHVRGSISRRLIADKTGLPRETVRRKVADLVEGGHVSLDQDDGVRIAQGLYDQRAWQAIEDGHRAVLRYFDRIASYGVEPMSIGGDGVE
ncbi:MAG TPA: hypothetical protein PKY87_09540 [Terricaulis sp.]|nr:hypothetical protein [Terricaulis sp.]